MKQCFSKKHFQLSDHLQSANTQTSQQRVRPNEFSKKMDQLVLNEM